MARSFGPAVGGVIVLAVGSKGAFATNALAYLPLLGAFFLWRRKHVVPRLPPEGIARAIISGTRYALHSFPVRTSMVRAFAFGLSCASAVALAPLVARDLLKGNASTYGLMLGCTGVGAVAGALHVNRVKAQLKAEHAFRWCAIISGLMIMVVGLSRNLLLTGAAMAINGATNILTIALLNVGVQLSVPRWVTARALSWFQASLTGGIAVGAGIWGHAAGAWGVKYAFLGSGTALMLTPLIGLIMPIRSARLVDLEMVEMRKRTGGRTGDYRAQRTHRNRDRLPSGSGQSSPLLQHHAEAAARKDEKWCFQLVAVARHCRSSRMDRAISISHLGGLSSPTQPIHACGPKAAGLG